MSIDAWRDVAAVSLALDFYRAPAKHPGLLHGVDALPRDMATLLRLAAGGAPNGGAALASPEESRAAARFFVEQVMFRHDASYYRVLGLNQGAEAAQIKEHHRLLMRLFHPDRSHAGEGAGEDWGGDYAVRVNLAYNTLRDAEACKRYNATLKTQTASVRAASKPAVKYAPMDAGKSLRAVRLETWFRRYLPQWVLGGTALLSLLVLYVVYQNNPPHGMADDREAFAAHASVRPPAMTKPGSLSYVGSLQVGSDAAQPELPEVDAEAEPEPSPVALALVEGGVQPGPEVFRHPPRAISSDRPSVAAVEAPPHPVAKPGAGAQEQIAGGAVASEPAPPPSPVADVKLPPPAASPVPPAVVPAQAPPPNPEGLLVQLAEAYERGDIHTLSALFDDEARTDAGGWWETRRDFETLFKYTELRNLRIEDLSWVTEGASLKGRGKYRITHMRKGESMLRVQSGAVRIELVRRGRALLLTGLFYTSGGRL